MDIERVNDHTLKFFISYLDIEDRGFDREEIWYNRERGEELFWDILDEAYHKEEFPVEGPLWIQVQALEKGLEILVTRAQLSKDGTKLELPISSDKHLDIPVNDDLENLLSENLQDDQSEDDQIVEEDELSFLISFNDFEDIIHLSGQIDDDFIESSLYHFDDKYYLFIEFSNDSTEYEQENDLSLILEFGEETDITLPYIQEYGKLIIAEEAITTIRHHFC
ncbi:adapter protein MecA 1/2 [Pullulanibacillus pueri]|uniref:Adapter protein MecA n=1 Tax=Pullulanibacillus pueri TaxID=1437324 RepID=A0A8J2ZWP2_9BACL|nr:adaptor protein MecA [Pullulanibacillus pueri]MBM7680591.1 adapter protein MecA 1/2 [Pullulanibacillus pueri]GGH84001.1 adapter protein MecA 1 [Pullulanibacillus pueri]